MEKAEELEEAEEEAANAEEEEEAEQDESGSRMVSAGRRRSRSEAGPRSGNQLRAPWTCLHWHAGAWRRPRATTTTNAPEAATSALNHDGIVCWRRRHSAACTPGMCNNPPAWRCLPIVAN